MGSPASSESDVLQSLSGRYGTVLVEWTAFNDFSTERNLNWVTSMILLEVVFVIIALLTRQWLLVIILLGTAIVSYVVFRFPPKKIENAITTLGVVIDGTLYKWSELTGFWILEEPVHTLLGFETKRRINKDEIVLIDDQDPSIFMEIIARYLPQREKEVAFVDVALETLGYRVRMLLGKFFKNS
ncbi:MAG: hypothetical protein WCP97_09145 [bacterium]